MFEGVFEKLRGKKKAEFEPAVRENGNFYPKHRKDYSRDDRKQIATIQTRGWELLEVIENSGEVQWSEDTVREVNDYMEWAKSYPIIPAGLGYGELVPSFRYFLRGSTVLLDMKADEQIKMLMSPTKSEVS